MLSETGPSTSSAEQGLADDVDARSVRLIGEGKRNLLVGDAPSAVISFQEACEILSAKYGEVSDQCADAYYHYGNALLELGRMETGVLGNALDGVPEGAATDTDDETAEGTAATTNFEKASKLEDTGAGTTDMGDDTTGGTDEDEDSEEDSANTTAEDESKEDNPDDIPNFQLAWEMLELARVIFNRKTDTDHKLKVAQVHFKLGELGLETEQYGQSLEDFSICLDIQKAHLEPESRLIAGSHYNLGLAYTFDTKMDKAMEHFCAAKKTIEDRISKLGKEVKEAEEKKEHYEETIKKMKKEITELEELTPDVLSKIEDAKESSRGQSTGETSSGFDKPSSSSGSSSAPVKIQVKRKPDAGEVCNISHLVKRKRPENDCSSNTVNETEAKRTKQEGDGDAKQVNGNSTEAGQEKKTDASMQTS